MEQVTSVLLGKGGVHTHSGTTWMSCPAAYSHHPWGHDMEHVRAPQSSFTPPRAKTQPAGSLCLDVYHCLFGWPLLGLHRN